MAGRFLSSVIPILLLSFTSSAASSGEESRSRVNRRLGYFFSRSRGICSPLYWSSRRESWSSTVLLDSAIASVFGTGVSERYSSSLTLLESMARDANGRGPFGRLMRHGTADLLNSYKRSGFLHTAWEVKTLQSWGWSRIEQQRPRHAVSPSRTKLAIEFLSAC